MAKPGAAVADCLPSGGFPDGLVGAGELTGQLIALVGGQPGLVAERVVADFVAGVGNGSEALPVLLEGGILANHEHGDAQAMVGGKVEEVASDSRQVRGVGLPGRIPVGLLVGPQVVQIQRQACLHPSFLAARSASCTVSFTLRVPFTMCAEFTTYSPGTVVVMEGTRSE